MMNEHVSSRSTKRAESITHRIASLALYGGTPAVPPGTVTPWPAPKKEHLDALAAVLESGKYHRVNHPIVADLEKRLAQWTGHWAVRAVGSGTAALHIALDHYKNRGHRVLTAALNWPGAVGPISISGLEPTFVDVELNLAGIKPDTASEMLEPGVAAVLTTHLFGNNIFAPSLRAAARARGVALIDDVCQSVAATTRVVDGDYIDSDVLALSGNGAKHLGAGELGFLLTRDIPLIEHVDEVSLTSSSRDSARIFSPNSQGYNYRPNVLSCSIADYRVKHLDQQLYERRANAAALWQGICHLPGLLPLFDPSDKHNSVLSFPLRIVPEELGFPSGPAARDLILKLLQAEGVPVWLWLTKPVFDYLPSTRGRWSDGDFPNTMMLLDTMFYVSEIAPPNDADVIRLYVDAFHKIWEVFPSLTSKLAEAK
ncbi:Putative glutamine-dependent sugar transaminase [Neorhizobium galegae bv. officinalis]|uniref:Putative glutamine-dependent sugar transaminase n=2 Tax=Neorhizobium galegae TaxID=399 RepID=A0A0T7G1N4_NEOGA|nr:Putative glutamine-dependent sugar transaminase [Neorhizobium galegae bv. officinalis]CDZ53522.1 Putative glutamine-dependent sugar transaminase [Neorhizobium galegae bv. officinalis]